MDKEYRGRAQRLLLVEPDPLAVGGVSLLAARQPAVQLVGAVGTLDGARTALDRLQPDLILAEVRLPGRSGVHLAEFIARRAPQIDLTLMTIAPTEQLEEAVAVFGVEVRAKSGIADWFAGLSRHSEPESRPIVDLSVREREVAQLVAQGKSSSEIAQTLGISSESVKTYAARAMSKYNVHSRVELALSVVGMGN
ncbi:MAG TPA: response regulator transcription factor [Microbacteriaceae bacterium]|nr:response regulator transcription factor [Microbacteriaceae bacterium]